MRKIRNLINTEKRVYIVLRTKAIQYRFMSDAEREEITYGDGVLPTGKMVDEVMSLHADGTICSLGWAGRMLDHCAKEQRIRVDYEKYIDGAADYIMD